MNRIMMLEKIQTKTIFFCRKNIKYYNLYFNT